MVRIKIQTGQSHSDYRGFSCLGHAGFGENGTDIVCAAVSMLVINTINAIDQLTEDAFTLESREEDGMISVRFPEELSGKGQLLMDAMVLGLSETAKEYGKKFIRVLYEEVA